MQDLHAIGDGGGCGGAGGQFYGGGGGDRRFRPHNHVNHQALKCPRCDSLNTKFCYYNNYNLSQPRHFCKACRRYWTKGGVLRSVPVGGGCRKTKRSKAKSGGADVARERKSKAQSPSSTDSSSLTAAAPAVADDGSQPSSSAARFNFSDSKFFTANPSGNPNPSFGDHQLFSSSADGQISTEIGDLTGMMTSSQNAGSVVDFHVPPPANQRPPVPENVPGSEIAGIGEVDVFWGSGVGGGDHGDQGLFELTAALDPAYWSQPQWTDNDHSLNYLP